MGDPPASVVAFGSKNPGVDVLEVGDAMGKRGWHLAGISQPNGVHIAVTVRLQFVLCFRKPMILTLGLGPFDSL